MAIFYLDFENGNDALDGTTFANRWKTITNGATAARIAPGDEIRIMGSPAPTSLGVNGTWTSGALEGTKNITGTTNTAPISVTCNSHGYSTGDTVVITSVGANTNANGTWEITVTDPNTFTLNGSTGNASSTSSGQVRLRNNTRVMLTSPVTQNVAACGPIKGNWVYSTSVQTNTTTRAQAFKEHQFSEVFQIQAAFTTGKAAYLTFPTILDLSNYQQLSLWMYGSSLPVTSGHFEIRLCSDSTGDIAVDTFQLPALLTNGRWQAATLDKGSALGSNINSIALYVNTDFSAAINVALFLDNIIACKASNAPDSLTLTSLIGKNTTGETWWGIQSINGTRVMLDAGVNALPTGVNVRGYYGTSETVTTWKRETIKVPNTGVLAPQENGTDSDYTTYSGGWDRTDMSNQNLETVLDGINGSSNFFSFARSFIKIQRISGVRGNRFLNTQSGSFCEYDIEFANNFSAISSQSGVIVFGTANGPSAALRHIEVKIGHIVANSDGPGSGGALSINDAGDIEMRITGGIISNNFISSFSGFARSYKMTLLCKGSKFANNNGGASIPYGEIRDANFELNSGTGFSNAYGPTHLYKCIFDNTNEVVASSLGPCYSHNHDQIVDNHKIFMSGALISSATDQRKTASGISWKIQPTSTSRSASWPIILSLAKVACAANSLVTVKAWMRRSDTGLTMRLVCKGDQITGVDNDVVDAMTAAADTWAEQTITFTPTETGVVEITAEAWGGTTFSGWVDDMTISQA